MNEVKLWLELPSASYPITIGYGLLNSLPEQIPQTTVAVVSDANVYGLHGASFCAQLEQAGKCVYSYTVAAGEASKSFATYQHVLRSMLADGLDRHVAVVALGGGVVGDLAGFVAATYLRGVVFYQCPTSLLAMVDASIGGKTAINVPEGKNLVGAFWQPKAVFADLAMLETLPPAIFREGAVELFKHGLLANEALTRVFLDAEFQPPVMIKDNMIKDPLVYWLETLKQAIDVKVQLVMEDVHEQGSRAYLNLGHTLGHALEAYSHSQQKSLGYTLSHGEAVAYGLLFAMHLAKQRGYTDLTETVMELLHWLEPHPIPQSLNLETFPQLDVYLYKDKKIQQDNLRWILLEDIGKPIIVSDIGKAEFAQASRAFLQQVEEFGSSL